MPNNRNENDASLGHLPPGQQLVSAGKWPLVGESPPAHAPEPWLVEVGGCVDRPRHWTIDQLRALPQETLTVDIHCVTRWSKPAAQFRGVRLERLLDAAGARADAQFVSFLARSERGHSTSLPLADALQLGALLALDCNGRPLPVEHGGPIRIVTPGRYFYKSLKWLARIELLAEDRLGYWEAAAGYHNHADPWREERYIASSVSRQQAARLIASRDFTGQDLRGLSAAGRDLSQLRAADALLRDADFRDCDLRGADFTRANLSNAHLGGADLKNAALIDADCEGANFSGADLRRADFTGASLLAASFSPTAMIDATTRIAAAQIDTLMPVEAAYVQAVLCGGKRAMRDS